MNENEKIFRWIIVQMIIIVTALFGLYVIVRDFDPIILLITMVISIAGYVYLTFGRKMSKLMDKSQFLIIIHIVEGAVLFFIWSLHWMWMFHE